MSLTPIPINKKEAAANRPEAGPAMEALALAVEGSGIAYEPSLPEPADLDVEFPSVGAEAFRVDPVDLVASEVRLKSMPLVVHQLEKIMQEPGSSADDMARVISMDTGLSAQLLRVVNSAMYGFPSKVETVSRAVTILGTRRLSMLALGATVVSAYKDGVNGLDMESFWRHSVGCAVVARGLAVRSGKEPGERAFVAGLLHDIGKLAFFSTLPEAALAVQSCMVRQNMTPCQAETAILGFDHARLGAILLRKWNFPLPLAKSVLYHHTPWQAADPAGPSIVHVADVVCRCCGLDPEPLAAEVFMDEETFRSLGLADQVFEEVLEELELRLAEITQAFTN